MQERQIAVLLQAVVRVFGEVAADGGHGDGGFSSNRACGRGATNGGAGVGENHTASGRSGHGVVMVAWAQGAITAQKMMTSFSRQVQGFYSFELSVAGGSFTPGARGYPSPHFPQNARLRDVLESPSRSRHPRRTQRARSPALPQPVQGQTRIWSSFGRRV